ncbi:zinc-finger domain-containing protein [Paralcaligenes sp. KSB-10]|uniref:zinc-finger domain-containing protein n=1 Tax=Paralcaligenes sp. KSB-10 TaxID=2901142 RepID=UPI001E31FBCF|nr:zinc-finger domain-containing protein [Paralcaligenes sp. KSB-10]UHL62503.1 zinc-finger domain-containing protein [Paralcaligenes sp. KSB-10]
MTSAAKPSSTEQPTIFVEAKDLPVYCPGPHAPLWSMHPRVYIEVVKTGKALCPYCGAAYQLKDGEHVHGH